MQKPEIKAGCLAWLETAWEDTDLSNRQEFLQLDEDDLISYHMTLCLDMRNDNKLWTHKDVIGCPDEFSMSVLYDFWREKNGL